MPVTKLKKLTGTFTINLPKEPVSPTKTKLDIMFPNPKIEGFRRWVTCKSYECYKDAEGHHVKFKVAEAQEIIEKERLTRNTNLTFRFQYVPKRKRRKRKT